MSGAWDRPAERVARLAVGLVLFGVALALLVQGGLGLDPWSVFNQGIAGQTGLSLGTVTVLGSFAILLAWIPLGVRPGVGTIANALVVGPVLDLAVAALPEAHGAPAQLAFATAGVGCAALASGLYLGVGWGPGPRDGLMTGLHARFGIGLARARASVEASVLVLGVLLGGTAGLATVAFAVAIGPLVRRALDRLRLPARPVAAWVP